MNYLTLFIRYATQHNIRQIKNANIYEFDFKLADK